MISDVGSSVFSCVMLFPGRAPVHVVSCDRASSIDFIFRDLFGAGLDREYFGEAVVHGPEALDGSELEECRALPLFSYIHNGSHADRLSKMAGFYKANDPNTNNPASGTRPDPKLATKTRRREEGL
jgi:hypothetical protein